MSCYACTRKYGFFCKESGCGNCGYSFCLKCLKNEIEVPRLKNKKEKVCLRCFEALSFAAAASKGSPSSIKTNSTKTKLEPNEIFETDNSISLDPVLQPISVSTAANEQHDEIAKNLDSEINRRLLGLKDGDTLPGDDEIRSRLCNLKGQEQKEYSKKDILLSTDQRTEQEKINELLHQFVEENQINLNVGSREPISQDPITEIERRLAALRGSDSEANRNQIVDPNTPSDNEEDESMLKNIIQRYVDEARLPSSVASTQPVPTNIEANSSTEELPWCTICNEDAVVRCESCGGDLFCKSCFEECHRDDDEWREHITQTYSKPPEFKENHF